MLGAVIFMGLDTEVGVEVTTLRSEAQAGVGEGVERAGVEERCEKW